ncbi:hypothetical protein HB976_18760 [Yersinia mollaretii]|uniref:Tellurite resistance protein n=1 Tax=Yersinia mollaretii TaxID=33060 RepID=A0AA36LLF5_YERMO|nr:TerB family tellurite resistance protein [Yersinia mollaretii]MDA5525102.1 TerB family tellurite resistance protein [Yersinia mollaretii]MDA5537167.1 TerB family tellurite resistance protein [Yersinia mollaretii]MDR7875442.1 TerB family tellurite resistance protein [Yersinia mollaretii]NIL04982.1 hypothetical protein [Yersinia mollaretii]PHZ29996.1 hypothetical protein CS537_19380 [Yersinia mollaretii]
MKKFDRDTALASWFFYQTYGVDKKVNTQQKLHYLRLLLACAKADGDISPGEMDYFIGAALARGCTEEMVMTLIENEATIDLSTEVVNFIKLNPNAKKSDVLSLLYSAMQVCAADGTYSTEEVNAVRKISSLLGISKEELQKVEDFFAKDLSLKQEARTLFVG